MSESDDFSSEIRGEMNINHIDVPRSTIVVAGLLWAVLCGLMTWNLIATINIKDKQADDIRVIAVQQAETNGRVTALEGRVLSLEGRR